MRRFLLCRHRAILLSGEIQHRLDVKEKMTARRSSRRNRRMRKWYRPKRPPQSGIEQAQRRLPASIKTHAEEVIRVVDQIALPISRTSRRRAGGPCSSHYPTSQGRQYQDRTRLDENLHIAV